MNFLFQKFLFVTIFVHQCLSSVSEETRLFSVLPFCLCVVQHLMRRSSRFSGDLDFIQSLFGEKKNTVVKAFNLIQKEGVVGWLTKKLVEVGNH